MPSMAEIGTVVIGKKNVINFVNVLVFSLFRYYLPLKKGMAFLLNKFDSSFHENALC